MHRMSFGNSADEVDEQPQDNIEAVGRHVYFYADVTTESCFKLMKTIRQVETDLLYDLVLGKAEQPIPIRLHIHTDGGDALAAFAIADQIKSLMSPVHSVVEGLCASAGTIISMACERRHHREFDYDDSPIVRRDVG